MNVLPEIFAPGTVTGWEALLAIVILGSSFVAAHFAKKGVQALGASLPGIHPELVSLSARVVKYSIVLFAVGVDLALLGANVQPLLAAVIIVGVIGYLALRGIAGNFGAAIVIQSRRSIHIGQLIEVLGFEGTVTELNSRAVVIATRDGRTVHIPNSSVLENPMVNHSERGTTRSSLEIRVRSHRDTQEIASLISTAAAHAEGVDSGHAPAVFLRSKSPGAATFELQIWHPPLEDAWSEANTIASAYADLAREGISATVVAAVPSPPLTVPPTP